MTGMAIAVGTALATLWGQRALDAVTTLALIVGGVAVGGGAGAGDRAAGGH